MEAHAKAFCNICLIGLFIVIIFLLFYIMSGNDIKLKYL